MRFDSVYSPLRGTGVAGHERIDPYWDGLWIRGSQGDWTRPAEARAQAAAGLVNLPKSLDVDRSEAWERVLDSHQWNLKLAFLAAVDSYRTTTSQQLAAITGAKFQLSQSSLLVPAMFSADLIDLGRIASGLNNGPAGRLGFLYRPSRTNAFTTHLAPELTYPELVSVTGGLPWRSGGFYDRHNMLSTELLLRAAEYTQTATVLGEKFSTFDLLFGTGVGRDPIDAQWRGDGVIVRADGMRIVLEVTASLTPDSIDGKMARWAAAFDDASFDTNGVIVVFVIANPPHNASKRSRVKKSDVFMRLNRAIAQFPGSGRVRTRHRMFVADWQEWFPSPGELSPSFLTLTAESVPGHGEAHGRQVPLLATTDLSLDHARFDAEAVIANAAGLRQTPLWLRQNISPPQIVDVETDAAGLSRIPVPVPTRKGRPHAKLHTGGSVADEVLPPPRLRTTTHNFHLTERGSLQWAEFQRLIAGDGA